MKHPSISVLTITRNRPSTIGRTIESILENIQKPEEIIIIDSSVDDDTRRVVYLLKKRNPRVHFIYKKVLPRGITYSLNIGIKSSKSKIIAKIDDDEYADKYWLKEIANTFIKFPEAKALTGSVIPSLPNNYWNKVWYEILKGSYRFFGDTDFIFGSNAAYKRSLFTKDNLYFDERTQGIAAEDSYISYKIRSYGYTIKYNYKIKVFHDFRTTLKGFFIQWMNYGISDYHLWRLYPYIKKHVSKIHIIDTFFIFYTMWLNIKSWPITSTKLIYIPGLFTRSFAYVFGIFYGFTTKKFTYGKYGEAK